MELNASSNYPILLDEWRHKPWFLTIVGILVALLAGWMIGSWGTMGILTVVGVPIVLIAGVSILIEPRIGLFLYVQLSFMLGASRFLESDLAVGTGLDAIAVLTLLSTFLNGKRMNWKRLRRPILWILIVWLTYTILEYFNFDHPFPGAWFYGARSLSINWFLICIILLVTPITKKISRP